MRNFTAVVERCPDTGLVVGFVPGFPGAHSQGETLEELNENLREVISMILEDGTPAMASEVQPNPSGPYSIRVAPITNPLAAAEHDVRSDVTTRRWPRLARHKDL